MGVVFPQGLQNHPTLSGHPEIPVFGRRLGFFSGVNAGQAGPRLC
jgi:hypothetical protein